ncbi:hypothetical protein I3843_16G094200 [Carya illinoinensis]|nr:hypothetical protein I3843_16G094200 [Carya illinoinensis]
MEESTVVKIECALDQSRKLNFRPSRRSIYRVPDLIRKVNEEAYTPQLISIGPFHYGSKKLQSMENFKLKFLNHFIYRTGRYKVEGYLVSIIKDLEQSVRECYEGTIEIESDDFVKMILLDACFIIEYFLTSEEPELSADHGDLKELKVWQTYRIDLDLRLLENQLPLCIINKLYEQLPLKSPSIHPSSFLELSFKFFANMNYQEKLPDDPDLEETRHVIDLTRYFFLPPRQSMPKRSFNVITKMYSASQLAEAGMKFTPKCWKSPRFPLNKGTEIFVRNLIALEQCHYQDEAYVTDYFIMLDFLINTGKDVDLLVRERILLNEMGTNSKPTLPSNLCIGISRWNMNDDYYRLSRKLVHFRRKHWYVILKSSLKQDYFRTPWMGAGTFGAIILLILTLIQTICTVITIFK